MRCEKSSRPTPLVAATFVKQEFTGLTIVDRMQATEIRASEPDSCSERYATSRRC